MEETNACLARGLEALKTKDVGTAVALFERATIDNPEDVTAFLYLGAAYAGCGRYNEAIGAFKRTAELSPNDAKIRYNLGQAYEAAGVPHEALHEYGCALKLDPVYGYARNAYAELKARLEAEKSQQLQFAA